MKKIHLPILYFIFILIAFIHVSCRKNKGDVTPPLLPKLVRLGSTVTTDSVFLSNVTASTAKVTGKILSIGKNFNEYGFVYATNNTPTIADKKILIGTSVPNVIPYDFQTNLTNLTNTTVYYVRSYVKDSSGIVYGEIKPFKTASNDVAIVQTTTPNSFTYFTAQVGGTITYKGSTNITEYGLVYSTTNSSPTTADIKKVVGANSPATFPSSFVSTLTNLSAGTFYYVRAYVINSGGTAYGSTLQFTTVVARPTTTTTRVTYNADTKTASVSGAVVGQGGGTITRYGFVYGTIANPTLSNSLVNVGTVVGTFPFNFNSSISFSGLAAGTYYVRAFSTNAYGTSYGVAEAVNVYFNPTVETGNYTTGNYIATLNGSITNGGSAPIQEYGIIYTLTANATFGFNYGDTGVLVLKGATSANSFPFNYSLNTSSPITTTNVYYTFKSYVKTVNGIVYGAEKTFIIISKD